MFFKILEMLLTPSHWICYRNISLVYKYLFLCRESPLAMANRTVKDANTIKGTNPQYLVEKIIR